MRMKQYLGIGLGVAVLTLAGCATVPADDGGYDLPEQPIDAPPPPPPDMPPAVDDTVPPPPPPPPPELLEAGLAWEINHSERLPWSRELRAEVKASLTSFDRATDWADFCPAYASLDDDGRVEVVATLAVAVARYQSSYDPRRVFREPGRNVDSVGLFQLSYEDKLTGCVLDRAARSLEDPVNNIRCAVPHMARLIAKDKVVTAGSTSANALGLARYWPVMRMGPAHKLEAIRAATRAAPGCLG